MVHEPTEQAMARIIGIVADDLTGALDAASPFARLGIRTRVLLDNSPVPVANVLALSTESRDDPVDAAEKAQAAVLWLRALGAQLIFKKIDSTMRGQVGSEVAAILDSMSAGAVAVVCPAYPTAGRVVVGGRTRIDGVDGADIAACFTEPTLLTGAGWRGLPLLPMSDSTRIVIADASTAEDLSELVDWSFALSRPVLLVGSGGLADAVARKEASARIVDPVLIVVGSRHRRSREQVAAAGAFVLSLPHATMDEPGQWERLALEARRCDPDALLITSGIEDVADPRPLERRLADVAAAVVREGAAGLVLTGGSTARAVLDALGARAITVQGELDAGIPVGRIVGGDHDGLPLITKAGGFGGQDAIAAAVEMIRKQTIHDQTINEQTMRTRL